MRRKQWLRLCMGAALLLCSAGCEEDLYDLARNGTQQEETDDSFGSGTEYTYDPDNPVYGVYRGNTTLLENLWGVTYYEFMDDTENYSDGESATCYVYFTKLNLVMQMSYQYSYSTNTISFGETVRYQSFGNDYVGTHTPFSSFNPYTDVVLDEDGLSCSYEIPDSTDPQASFTLNRLDSSFPAGPQNSSTRITVDVSNSKLSGRVVLVFGSAGSNAQVESDAPDIGCGIEKMDDSGQGTVTIHVPDALFKNDDEPFVIIAFGDIPEEKYWAENDGPPFAEYAGHVDENLTGGGDTLGFTITQGENITVHAQELQDVAEFDDN